MNRPLDEAHQNRVYVIGAGFSAGLGYPVLGDLLVQLWDRVGPCSFRDSLRRAIAFHNPGFNPTEFGSFPNVEELLSQLLVNEQLFDSSREYEGNFTRQELAELQRTLLLKISDWFHNISETVNPDTPSAPWLAAFREHVRRENAAIISFNWDLVLDKLLFGKELNKMSYGFPLAPFVRPVLIKPHGSLNWFADDPGRHLKSKLKFLLSQDDGDNVYAFTKYRAPKGQRKYTPLIVPPVYLKNFDKPVFRILWRSCTTLLSTAHTVVFLGYSMSMADFHAQFIMRCGFHNQLDGELRQTGRQTATRAATVIIVNPDRGAAERTRAIAGPEHKCRWVSRPIADLIWDNL